MSSSKVVMKNFWVSIFFMCLSISLRTSTLTDNHRYLVHNLTTDDDHHIAKLVNDISQQNTDDHPHYTHPPREYLRQYEDLLTRGSGDSFYASSPVHRNPHFTDVESHQKIHQSYPDIRIYRLSPYSDHYQEPDFHPSLKKHDFGGGGQNFEGWNSFPSGHNMGGGGGNFGLSQATGALKKGKEAKALFILMAPLILLAVFGPILATQAMIPWVANGGLNTVSTIATGKRRKRQVGNVDPRQAIEMEKRLQLFLEVQDFISRTGSQGLMEEMGEAFVKCQRYTERRNKCLERVGCGYTDSRSVMDPEERRIGRMVLRNVMSNPSVPSSLIGKLKKGISFGKKRPGQCANFWCEVVDNPPNKANTINSHALNPFIPS